MATPNQKRSAAVCLMVAALCAPLTKPGEGLVLKWYPDPVLKWKVATSCYGHTGEIAGKPIGSTFTKDECEAILLQDLVGAFRGIEPCMPEGVSKNALAAYLDLAHNAGAGAVCKSSIARKLAAGDYAAACATISDFRFVGKTDCALNLKVCGGIVARRAKERALCEKEDT